MKNKNKEYIPDGSGTVVINITDVNGKIIRTYYQNISDICPTKEDTEKE